ncbi:MAG: T9SS type A sorting domain-containing protein [Ignavibacteriaceae bacterium]|nr:T9SS type A sorting domain-containing protein [Ignavibacteriaceae bacterium]
MKIRYVIAALILMFIVLGSAGYAQVNISAGSTITETFTIGTSATATLPSGWKADKNTTARLVGSYSAAVTATEQRAGNSMGSSATNGIYNYAAGDPTSATDRAIGGISSSSASKSVNLYVQLTNNGAANIGSLTISYNVEKYRNGSNAAGYSIQMYYSTNGTSWTSAGSDFLTSFAADADNNGYATAPGATTPVTNKTLSQAIAASGSLYLAWNYSVTTGTTTSNAQALGVDDISIKANFSEPTSSASNISFSAVSGTGFTINWTNGDGAGRIVLVKSGSAVDSNPVDGTSYTANGEFGSGSQIGTGNYVVYADNSNSVVVTGLTAGTTYHVAVFEYNGSGTAINYKTSSPLTGNQTAVSSGTPTVTVSLTSLPSFGNIIAGSSSGEATYTVSGSSLSGDIVITAPTGFQVSTNSGSGFGSTVNLTPSEGSVAATTIYVRFSPATASGAFSGNITNASTGAETEDVAVSGNALDTEPTTQPTVTFGTVSANSVVVNFSGGDGEKRIIVAREGSAASFSPSDAATVTGVNADFTLASDQGSGNKVVYDGTGSTVTVTGLTEGTTYYFASYEYNEGTGTSQNYLTTSPGTNNTTTSGISVSVSSLTGFGNVAVGSSSGEQSYTVSATGLSADLVITPPTGFEVSQSSGSGFVSSLNLTPSSGIISNTTIYVRFTPGTTGAFSGNITNASSGVTTKNVAVTGNGLSAEPAGQAADVTFTAVGENEFTVNWTSGNGTNRIVLVKSGSAVNSNPVDGTSYTANTAFASGTQIGTGNYVVYNSTGSSVTVTGLNSGTTYHVAVYEFNGSGGSENYLTLSPATGSQAAALPTVNGISLYEFYNDPASSAGTTGGVNNFDWNGGGFSTSNDEFIEFANTGSSAVDVSGWIISDGNSWAVKIPASTSIPAYGFLVLGNTQGTFTPNSRTVFVDVDGIAGNFDGSWGLGNSGEVIFLINTGADGLRGGGDDNWVRYRLDGAADDTGPHTGTNTGSTTLSGTDKGVVNFSTPNTSTGLSVTINPQGIPLGSSVALHNSTNFPAATNGVSPGARADGYGALITMPSVTASVSSLSSFGTVVMGNSSAGTSFTVSGDDLTADVTVTAPTHFQVSLDNSSFSSSVNLPQSGGNLTGEPVTVYARLTPADAAGAVSGNITITSTDAVTANVSVSGTAIDTEPTTASTVSFGTVTVSSIVVNFTGGNGERRIVVARSGSAVDFTPADAAAPTGVNSSFTTAADQGSGNKIVYDGTGTTVTVTDLSMGTTYYFAVYEYNSGTGTSQNYYTSSPGTGNQATLTTSVAISYSSPAASDQEQGTANVVLMRFDLAVTNADATISGLTVTTAGTYAETDITSLKVRYSTDNTLDGGDATLSTKTASLGAGSHIFPSFTQQLISTGSTGYIFITADISATAVIGNTINLAATAFSNFTFSGTVTKTGTDPVPAGNSQTVIATSVPSIAISHAGLTEENLNGAVINITLSNETFVNEELAQENFTLNNPPAGTTINSIAYVDETSATLTLSYDGTDFDANVTNFNITIKADEFSGASELTSNNLTVTATLEVVPTVSTNEAITSKSATTAVWGGQATATGGEAVTQKGVVWSTSANPTVALETKTAEGAGLGAITGNITGLSPNTTYYVRAYATNSVGSGYGTEYNFTTDGLTSPVATAATLVTASGFSANWEAITGAESYRLDVAITSDFSSTTVITENFAGFTQDAGTQDRGASLNSYLQTPGWTGTAVYEMVGYAKMGAGSTRGIITTPTIDLSGNGGNNSITFDLAKFGSDAAVVQVLHAPDGTTFTQAGSDITAPASLAAQSVQITGGTAASKIRIQAKNTSNCRFYLDNIAVQNSTINAAYNNKTVNGTSEAVTGLSAGTTYYYRVRSFSTNSTSGNSNTISVTTPNNYQSAAVTAGANVPVAVGGSTGVGQITFSNVTNGGDVIVSKFNSSPSNVSGVTGNVSVYRWIIEAGSGMVFNVEEGYVLRFNLADISNHGISELEDGNNTSVKLYKRSTPGTGAFTGPITLTYNRNGTNGNQTDDYLLSAVITTGFSEFVFGSEDNPLPVELKSFTAKQSGESVVLKWSTATEVNNYGFEIERTEIREQGTGKWDMIGFVQGNGNSNSEKSYSFSDRNIEAAVKYIYRLKQIDTDGRIDYSDEVEVLTGIPEKFALAQNYPNPFNPATVIRYSIPSAGEVSLRVFNLNGEQVAELVNTVQEPGYYQVEFNASSLPSGVYAYELKSNGTSAVKKLVLLK